MTNAIDIEDLQKIYRAKAGAPVRALDGVSMQVPQGRVYGLLGPNGAGKSTLVKILSTITAPTAGRAEVLGYDVVRQPLDARRQMTVVLQQTAAETLLTVRDNLLIYAYLHGMRPREARLRLARVAEEFELGDKLRDTVQDLSIGTKRRIQVAKIFMLNAPLIILDEATTGMDPLMKSSVMERIHAETRSGRTVLMTTQVLSEAEQLCDTIMIINHGRMLASGTLADLRRLSQRMFRVNLTFADDGADVASRLAALEPVELEADGRTVEMLFRGEEASLLGKLAEISRRTPIIQFEVRGPSLEEIFVALVKNKPDHEHAMTGIAAVFYRVYRQRITNIGFVFWDMFVPLAYLALFGLGLERAFGGPLRVEGQAVDYTAFLLPGIIAMIGFSVAMNASWGFFMDKDSGIFYEVLTYPITRREFLVGQICFNVVLSLIGATLTCAVAALAMDIPVQWQLLPLTAATIVVTTAGWFFLFSVLAIRLQRMDSFNTVTSAAYIILMFFSTLFYPLDNMPAWFRALSFINPMTWQVDILRFSVLGTGTPLVILIEAVAFGGFVVLALTGAVRALDRAA